MVDECEVRVGDVSEAFHVSSYSILISGSILNSSFPYIVNGATRPKFANTNRSLMRLLQVAQARLPLD